MKVVDLFAGAGGSSDGARQAGARVVWAANHWPLAVEVHRRNHPETEHACQDLHQCDWRAAASHRPDLVIASPACTGSSKAASANGRRGSLPKHDRDRNTAWAVVSCLEALRAPVAVVENVLEMRTWVLFPVWLEALRRLGYTLHEHEIDAADLGVPQRRVRLFITAVRASSPLVLDLPSIESPTLRSVREPGDRRWRDIREVWGPKTQARVRRAFARHGECATNNTTDDTGQDFDGPSTTVTTKHQRSWIRKHRERIERSPWTGREYARAMGFSDAYELTGQVTTDCRLVGNAVCPPVMRAIVERIARVG